LVQNPEWACVLARAYNSWLAERFSQVSPRLKGVALLPVHEPLEAAKELERAKKLGLVAGLLPAVTWLQKGYGHTDFDPISKFVLR
jgi:predicted TIM-barrel fold metal-dependent hydrolase